MHVECLCTCAGFHPALRRGHPCRDENTAQVPRFRHGRRAREAGEVVGAGGNLLFVIGQLHAGMSQVGCQCLCPFTFVSQATFQGFIGLALWRRCVCLFVSVLCFTFAFPEHSGQIHSLA